MRCTRYRLSRTYEYEVALPEIQATMKGRGAGNEVLCEDLRSEGGRSQRTGGLLPPAAMNLGPPQRYCHPTGTHPSRRGNASNQWQLDHCCNACSSHTSLRIDR